MCFSFSDAFSVDIFSTRARCIKRYSNNGPLAAGMRRRRANIFGDLRISSYTPPSFDMITRVFENVLSSGSKRNENGRFEQKIARICENFKTRILMKINSENWCKGLQNFSDSDTYLCRFWKALKNASFLAIVAVNTAENERFKSTDFRSQSVLFSRRCFDGLREDHTTRRNYSDCPEKIN